jgi:AcrR family transcriptional regulator
MGRLISSERRERAKQAKKQRKESIRAEALRAFVKRPYAEITLDTVGREAGVKKGIASMYFGSKEELFLLLLREQLEIWYHELEAKLSARASRCSDAQLARLIARTLAPRDELTRLLGLSPGVLEGNMEIIEAYRFHLWHKERMEAVGRELERRSRGLQRGRGIRLLHLVQVWAGALDHLSNPRGSLAVNLHDPDFKDLQVDMEKELTSFVIRFLAGEGESKSAG